MARVVLEGLEFHARHGVYETEGVLGSRFIVDAELYYNFFGLPDQLDEAVNYAAVYDSIRIEVTESRVQLIEVLTERIAKRILSEQPKLTSIIVRVHKPFAPIVGIFRDVYAELRLEQSQ